MMKVMYRVIVYTSLTDEDASVVEVKEFETMELALMYQRNRLAKIEAVAVSEDKDNNK